MLREVQGKSCSIGVRGLGRGSATVPPILQPAPSLQLRLLLGPVVSAGGSMGQEIGDVLLAVRWTVPSD